MNELIALVNISWNIVKIACHLGYETTDLLGADTEIRVSLTLFVGFGKVFVIYNVI